MGESKSLICFLFIVSLSFITSCMRYPTYTPPMALNYNPEDNTQTINKDFNAVWTALIEYASSSFFAIKTFEKDSGLLTLQFGSGNPSEYVNCGFLKSVTWNREGSLLYLIQSSGISHADLDGNMNIFVKPIATNVTQIKINARYILLINDGQFQNTWAFDTGGSDTKQLSAIVVTCQPTHKAEQTILEGIKKIAQ